jgi:hypothetical protein
MDCGGLCRIVSDCGGFGRGVSATICVSVVGVGVRIVGEEHSVCMSMRLGLETTRIHSQYDKAG